MFGQSADEQEIARLRDRCDTLLLEAQAHAQEARTANATIAEIYQVVSGGRGECGNWHGAEPVRNEMARLTAELAQATLDRDSSRHAYILLNEEYEKAQAELSQVKQRCRFATQIIIESIGSLGSEDLESALGRIVAQLQQAKAREARLRTALEAFVKTFETDFVLDGVIVDEPARLWTPIEGLYLTGKQALTETQEGG